MQHIILKAFYTLLFLQNPDTWEYQSPSEYQQEYHSLKECKSDNDKQMGCIERKFYENGVLEEELPFKNNEVNGIFKGYYKNGKLARYDTLSQWRIAW